MKTIENKIMLVTYADSMGGDLKSLNQVLEKYFHGAIGGIHILPFFPSSGDRGFSTITYDIVEPAFGDWTDIANLSEKYYLMCDMMVNHISKRSSEFLDYQKNKDNSKYADMFLEYDKFWGPGRPTVEDLNLLYKRKAGEPYQMIAFADGEVRKLWCTFTDEQLDIDTTKDIARQYIFDNIEHLRCKGISIIRLDAYGYITKIKETDCFFVEPQIWGLIEECRKRTADEGMLLLPEVHATPEIYKKFEEHDLWIYDFVLPLLTMYSLYSGNAKKMAEWFRTCPRKQFTVLDTHDGIGVYDAYDVINQDEANFTIRKIEDQLSYSYKELDPAKKANYKSYQLYGTFYSMLHKDDNAYLLARALQFFAPGIPQVYYVGMLTGENDIDQLMKDTDHRSINRHNFTLEEIETHVSNLTVQKLLRLMRFRNEHPAFNGEIEIPETNRDSCIKVIRYNQHARATLEADLKSKNFKITYTNSETEEEVVLQM